MPVIESEKKGKNRPHLEADEIYIYSFRTRGFWTFRSLQAGISSRFDKSHKIKVTCRTWKIHTSSHVKTYPPPKKKKEKEEKKKEKKKNEPLILSLFRKQMYW